jgi:hypothetical protein
MAEKKITLRRGDSITVEIDHDEQSSARGGGEAGGPRRAVLLLPDDAEDVYAFRKGQITFYDLGTRQAGDVYSYVSIPLSVDFSEMREHYTAALLAGDFTEEGKCLLLPQASEFLYLDAIFTKVEHQQRKLIGDKGQRPFVKDFPAEGEPQPANVTETSFSGGKLKLAGAGFSFGVESAWFYNNFDTHNSDAFKVTADPDPSSAAVEFKTSAQPIRVYLTPRMGYESRDEGLYIFRFVPVLPAFAPVTNLSLTGIHHNDRTAEATASESFWSAIMGYWNSVVPGGFPNFFNIFDSASAYHLAEETAAPTLAAVIIKGEKKFYVWRTQADDSLPWSFSSIINPNP